MIGRGLFIRKKNSEGIVPAVSSQSLNKQDVFPVDGIVSAEKKLFFHGKPHFLHSIHNGVKLMMEV